ITDPSGGVVRSAHVTITGKENASRRELTTNDAGAFSAPALLSGAYEVRAEAQGFRTAVRNATIEAGTTTNADIALEVGAAAEVMNVQDATTQLDYDSHSISGVVTRQQLENLPLNGRSFLQLAFLEPGVTASAGPLGQYNRQFDVSVLGGKADTTRITIDGEIVNDPVTGGTSQNLSQEVVQEFQVSSANFDLATGIAAGGAINVVTRSGTNAFHGTGFFYFRDHNLAAYPGLTRHPLNPDPFFARRQTGFSLGGPVKKNKLFFFTSYEHANQQGVFTAEPADPAFAAFNVVYGAPYHSNQFDARLDYHISDKHMAYVRYSHDGNDSLGQHTDNSLPSNWTENTNYSDSGTFSLISPFSSHFVNEARFGETFWKNNNHPPTLEECPGCLGLGGPQVMVIGTGLQFGNTTNSPQSRLIRRYIASDNVSWHIGAHQVKFGGEWEYEYGVGTYGYLEPGYLILYSPRQVAQYNSLVPASLQIPVRSSYTTLADILSLPLYEMVTAVGEVGQPPQFQRGNADHNNRTHFYVQDSWKVTQRLTLNVGLAHSYESNLINYDLSKPAFLAPLFGANGLTAPSPQTKNFSPAFGFSWSPWKSAKTVIRGGFGIYYDTIDITDRLIERGFLGPLGTGRPIVTGSVFPNPIGPGTIQFTTAPTRFTGALTEQLLPTLRGALAQQLNENPANTDLTIRNINVFKTTNGTNGDLIANNFRVPYAEHFTIGLEHQIANDFVVRADFVYRHFVHNEFFGIDVERFLSLHPVLPVCSAANAVNPAAACANGPITALLSEGRGTYKGLLVKADRRFARRYQLQASYAYQRNEQTAESQYDGSATGEGVFDLNSYMAAYGEVSPHLIVNVSGIAELPWGFQLSFISSMQSRLPFQPFIPGVDLTGSGVNGFALPGSGFNQFNVGLGKSDLMRLVQKYNQTYAGKPGLVSGQAFPAINLPASYDLGRAFNSQDLRVTKYVPMGTERVRLKIFGELFNALNYANLQSFSNNLTSPGFGKPAERTRQIFGTGGPRAFQFGARLNF
ncbi:MAG: carboxypeptidase regulatory-like domain-containing protein, partial [Acidobacteriota bacterium]|nr:carboxypeptidase regulatory-like domain-containing protein [Acidobacteriota bacterium]